MDGKKKSIFHTNTLPSIFSMCLTLNDSFYFHSDKCHPLDS